MQCKQWSAALVLGLAAAFAPAYGHGGDGKDGIAEAVQLVRREAGSRRLLLLGEKHGTREIPDLVAALVAAYADDGPVLLGLEVPRSQHPLLRRYLASDGNAEARASLRAGAFWQVDGDQHDGRRSHDMLDLVDALRTLRAQGRDVALLPYDVEPDSSGDHHARDLAMAGRVRTALAALPRGRLLVLAGNVHAMLDKPDGAPPEMQVSMGAHLRELDPYAIDITAHGGRYWACMRRCGPVDEFPAAVGSGPLDGRVYDLRIVLPEFRIARLLGATPAR